MSFVFGDLEGLLAEIHSISHAKRTKFAARLKNLHRHGFPKGLVTLKGRPTEYRPHEIFMMALATEFMQLGMTPERIVTLLNENIHWAQIAVRKAVSSLESSKRGYVVVGDNPGAHFLCFDPRGLSSIMDQDRKGLDDLFFYLEAGMLEKYVVSFTEGTASRAALINCTSLIDLLFPRGAAETEAAISELKAWAKGSSNGDT